jgi:hypothetical protein
MPGTALYLLLVVQLVLASCAYPVIAIKPTRNEIEDLIVKKDLYLSLLEKRSDNIGGHFKIHECDGLLYSGMLYAAGFPVDIEMFHVKPGRWYRTPDKRCYSEGRSGSDVSRDMFAGLLWGLYAHQRRDLARDIYRYGFHRAWLMGRGSVDRVFLSPNFQNTILLLIGRGSMVGESWVDPIKDHQRHVVMLNLGLRGEIQNGLTIDQWLLVAHLKKRMPRNALASFVYHRFLDGNQAETIAILEDTRLFPDGRLPRSSDRCSYWLWVREDKAKYREPCNKNQVHTGGDFIFIVWLLERSLN